MNEIIFAGALPDAPRRNKVKWNPKHSRCFKQAYRVFSSKGIEPALSAEEMQGRYWVLIEI